MPGGPGRWWWIPFDAVVTSAALKAYVAQATPSLGLFRVTRDWANSGASTPTFLQANPTAAWTSSGGDIDLATAGYKGPGYLSAPADGPNWVNWEPTQLVQDWVSRRGAANTGQANQGMLIKPAAVGPGYFSIYGTNSANPPELTVNWSPRRGVEPNAKFDSYRLTDRLNAQVNLANGNLVVGSDDVNVAGTGLDLSIGHTFNGSPVNGFAPSRFSFEAQLTISAGSVLFQGPRGEYQVFVNTGTGFLSPLGTSADLTQSGSSYTLTDRKSKEKLVFGATANASNNNLRFLSSDTDRNGNAIVYNYGSFATLTSITDTQGRVITVAGTGNYGNWTITLADQFGRTWRYHYANVFTGNPDYSVDPENKTTTYAYDPNNGLLTQITTPEGRITRFSYNAEQRVARVSRVTDPATGASVDTNYSYSSDVTASRCAQVAPPGGAPGDPVGMVGCTTVTDARGSLTSHGSDSLDQVVKVIDGRNNVTTSSFSAARQVVELADAVSAAKTRFNYDAAAPDKPTGAILPTGAASALAYRAGSANPYSPDSATDFQGNCSAFTYTASANLATVSSGLAPGACTGPGGAATVTNAYEGEGATCGAPAHRGRLCRSTDARGAVTSYTYDANGNLIRIAPPAPLGASSYTPDGLGRTRQLVDAKGQRSTLYYDRVDRLVTITYAGDDACTNIATCIGFYYDGDGNLLGRSDVTGAAAFVYDRLGRLVEKWPTGAANACAGYNGTRFTYDAVGNLASVCDAGGTVAYTYDAANELTSVIEPGGSCSPSLLRCTTYTYIADHQRATTSYPGGVGQSFAYDASGRVSSVSANGRAFSYCYRLNNDCGANPSPANDTTLLRKVTDSTNYTDTRYSYDALNRLTVADTLAFYSRPDKAYRYAYDANGNRSTAAVTGGPTTYYDYNAANQACLRSAVGPNNCVARPGDQAYTYDANGSQLMP